MAYHGSASGQPSLSPMPSPAAALKAEQAGFLQEPEVYRSTFDLSEASRKAAFFLLVSYMPLAHWG